MPSHLDHAGRHALVLVASVALMLSSCSADENDTSPPTGAVGASTTSASTGSTEGDRDLATELGRYTPQQVDERIYLLVDPDTSEADLISAATAWHQLEPEADLNFFDDDAEIATILKLLPKTETGDTTGFPSDWVAEHQVARLQRFVNSGDGKAWKLGFGASVDPQDTLVDLP